MESNKHGKQGKAKPLGPDEIEIDPDIVYFTFSRVRPFFSCGRPVQATLDALLKGEINTADLPQISLLFDGRDYFSLNNRRLFVFKTLKQAGKLQTVRARVKPVPQTKRMKTKYTVDKCSLTAKLIREGAPEDRERSQSDQEDEEERPVKKSEVKAKPSKRQVSDDEDDDDW